VAVDADAAASTLTAEPGTDELDVDAHHDADAQPIGPDGAETDIDEPLAGSGRWSHRMRSEVGLGWTMGIAILAVLAGLTSWLGVRVHHQHQVEQQRQMFLQAGRQAAIDLTSIGYPTVDADVQRVLAASTGSFNEEFQQRSAAFSEVVRQAKATSEGSVTDAGVESVSGDSAQILVAVSVKTSNAGAPEQEPRYWRMRITVQNVGGSMKAANVGFVP
jgi:Mce-associated membrane protein